MVRREVDGKQELAGAVFPHLPEPLGAKPIYCHEGFVNISMSQFKHFLDIFQGKMFLN